MKIGNVEITGKAVLAPMAGITDRAFREICKQLGAAYVVTEMVSAKAIIHENKKTLSLMELSDYERPCGIQIFSGNPNDLEKATYITLEKFAPDIIDINLGCPAPKINKSGAGAVLMKDPKLCFNLVKACVKSTQGKIPVTVKIRSGISKKLINAVEIAKHCECAGASAITIHGRTKEDLYKGEVDLEIIKNVKESVKVPVIGNGDIKTANDAKNMLDKTSCDLVMIGRGSIGRPYIFDKINKELKGINFKELSKSEKIGIMKYHVLKVCSYKGEDLGIKQIKKHIYAYLKDLGASAKIKNEVQNLKKLNDFEVFLEDLKEFFGL